MWRCLALCTGRRDDPERDALLGEQAAVQALQQLREVADALGRRLVVLTAQQRERDPHIRALAAARRPGAAAADDEAAELRALLARRRAYNARLARQRGVLLTVEQAVGALEDALTMRPVVAALRHSSVAGARVALSVHDVDALLERVREQEERAVEVSDAFGDFARATDALVDEDELAHELAALARDDDAAGAASLVPDASSLLDAAPRAPVAAPVPAAVQRSALLRGVEVVTMHA